MMLISCTYANSGFLEINQVGDKRQGYQTSSSNIEDTRTDVVKQKSNQAQYKNPQYVLVSKEQQPNQTNTAIDLESKKSTSNHGHCDELNPCESHKAH